MVKVTPTYVGVNVSKARLKTILLCVLLGP